MREIIEACLLQVSEASDGIVLLEFVHVNGHVDVVTSNEVVVGQLNLGLPFSNQQILIGHVLQIILASSGELGSFDSGALCFLYQILGVPSVGSQLGLQGGGTGGVHGGAGGWHYEACGGGRVHDDSHFLGIVNITCTVGVCELGDSLGECLQFDADNVQFLLHFLVLDAGVPEQSLGSFQKIVHLGDHNFDSLHLLVGGCGALENNIEDTNERVTS